jgi:hypothetical protein
LDRVLEFAHAETAPEFQAIATIIRSITDVRQVDANTAQRALLVRGTASQIALAEWLFHELDQPGKRPAPQSPNPATHEYRLPWRR